jgi:hypothetical protein
VLEISGGFFHEQMVRDEVERALELVPEPFGDRVRGHDDGTVVELVTNTRLFTATVTSDQHDYIVVEFTARRLDDTTVDVNMTQRRGRRAWTFRFDKDDTVTVDRSDDEAFARALAAQLGWAAPDAT